MRLNDLVIFPGILFETGGVILVVIGILRADIVLLVSGVGLICVGTGVHIIRIVRRTRAGSVRQDTARPAPSGTVPEQPGSPLIYQDRLVRISDNAIEFLHYSFPFFTSGRQVQLQDIDHIDVRKPTVLTGKWRIGGSGNLRTWFPLDWDRPSRDRIFHAFVKTRGMDIGFTVEDPIAVTAILKKKGLISTDEVGDDDK
jgi:hypothetical protein